MKPLHWLSLSILLIGAGVGGYLLWGKKEEGQTTVAHSDQRNQPPSSPPRIFAKVGDRGPKVKKLQEFVNSKGYRPPLAIDSIFGPKTQAGVRAVFGSPEVTEEQWNNRASI